MGVQRISPVVLLESRHPLYTHCELTTQFPLDKLDQFPPALILTFKPHPDLLICWHENSMFAGNSLNFQLTETTSIFSSSSIHSLGIKNSRESEPQIIGNRNTNSLVDHRGYYWEKLDVCPSLSPIPTNLALREAVSYIDYAHKAITIA